jgi:hypothetical protein
VGRIAHLLAWALLACPLVAQSYKVELGDLRPGARVEVSVGAWRGLISPGETVSTSGAGWQVTIAFDAERCAVYCAYRPLRNLLAPPVVTIGVLAGLGSAPRTFSIDPISRSLPRAGGKPAASYQQFGAPSRRLANVVPAAALTVGEAAPFSRQPAPLANHPSPSFVLTPLRI